VADDPYSVLGLPWGASPRAIRAAFRKLASVHHPDRNRGDPKAEARFKLISAAYQRLKESGWALPDPPSPSPSPPAAADDHAAPEAAYVRPQRWPDGRPIHYPSAEEIAALQRDGELSIILPHLRRAGDQVLRAVAYLYVVLLVGSVIVILCAALLGLLRNW